MTRREEEFGRSPGSSSLVFMCTFDAVLHITWAFFVPKNLSMLQFLVKLAKVCKIMGGG